MDQKMKGFVIGVIGALITFSAYYQTIVSTTGCIAAGFFVLIFGLLVREGFISI
ncbi:hypothetical protein Syun_023547 [Stephania yunnanensis]|uniref:Uncharacterized protein n=1 Tax=Stephania yunnanensis TaxID=152371 RepID=A0AAP0I3D8_9MAGN